MGETPVRKAIEKARQEPCGIKVQRHLLMKTPTVLMSLARGDRLGGNHPAFNPMQDAIPKKGLTNPAASPTNKTCPFEVCRGSRPAKEVEDGRTGGRNHPGD